MRPLEALDVVMLVHEVWEEINDGMVLHSCCLAGPMGEKCRHMLGATARLLTTFKAGNHFEAMTVYNRFLGREMYTTDQPWDYRPYPQEWLSAP